MYTYDDRVWWLAISGSAIPQIWSVGDLIMPLLHLYAEANDFSYIKVECPFFILPYPDLVLVIATSCQY
jgi:hypothetical protein